MTGTDIEKPRKQPMIFSNKDNIPANAAQLNIIGRFTALRDSLLPGIYAIVNVGPYTDDTNKKDLQKFCQDLTDYLAAGALRAYPLLEKEGVDCSQFLTGVIDNARYEVLDFAEKYAMGKTTSLKHDVEVLIQNLATVGHAEDKAIKEYLQRPVIKSNSLKMNL